MRILVNALSAESLSGKHVLYGHLSQLAHWSRNHHEFHVVFGPRTKPVNTNFGPNVHWHLVPSSVDGWFRRTVWEAVTLPKRMNDWGIDLYFTPSGTTLPRSTVPQVSLAQNPWCLTDAVPKSILARLKAVAQRVAYRNAQRTADLMIYNSKYMRELYRRNAGAKEERHGLVVYQGISNETHANASQTRDLTGKRPLTILSVSVMARWKNCETLLRALKHLHERGIDAKARFIGAWPDKRYRAEFDREALRLNVQSHIQIDGHVSQDELYKAYRTARVYCLLSRCESFGIPAIEAQAYGTPVVGSISGAMPEIGGPGGVFVDPDDSQQAAGQLERLLTDDSHWASLSRASVANADRFRWEQCSRPLMEIFSIQPTGQRRSATYSTSQQQATI